MISFKQFVTAIQDAIVTASDAIMDKNISLLDKYFTEAPKPAGTDSKHTLIPKSVILEYPHLTSNGEVENLEVAVPLITLVPLSMSKVEKAFLTAHFEMEIVDDEVQLHFSDKGSTGLFNKKPKTAWGKIELTFSPQETPEGFKLLIAGYEDILKRQIA
ncbi:uncharacterized protein DUF2589 [Mucilaginibacter gracilis]|uniref:Uncharacterized protein DUF2589 n=1 Tax=Mucilaginibacter gracilis TaxID=423350 RepID=A0A495J6R5_9SPHI|nr:DUF2589 domain-containing protein [Mucilaginibacter gracilis]RKR83709.1 uncharacterized protein DUF2589 [Mucilaginibacter gracilis]